MGVVSGVGVRETTSGVTGRVGASEGVKGGSSLRKGDSGIGEAIETIPAGTAGAGRGGPE